MAKKKVTVAVIPRERFSVSLASLESIYANTDYDFDLIYIDGNSPAHIAAELKEQSKEKNFKLLRYDRYLAPNQARNIAIENADSEYIAFVDNDNFVTPGWLDHLVGRADTTGSVFVAPIYIEGRFENEIVHTAGGDGRLEATPAGNHYRQQHFHEHRKLSEVRAELKAKPITLVEFHVLLARKSFFDETGPLNEKLLSMAEENDVCLDAMEKGYQIYFEPEAVVAYDYTFPYDWSDLPYFTLRWCQSWTDASIQEFKSKWDIAADDPYLLAMSDWVGRHRQIVKLPSTPVDAYLGSAGTQTMHRGLLKVIRHATEFSHKLQTATRP